MLKTMSLVCNIGVIGSAIRRAKREFYWKGIKTNVKRYIRECDICQRIKFETFASTRLL